MALAAGPPTEAIAAWWGTVFGVDAETEDGKDWWWIAKLPGVPFDRDALIGTGATLILPKADGRGWDVLADPDGNEFCVFAPKG